MMVQRLLPFALMCAMWLVPLAAVHAQTQINYDFEDGIVRGTPSQMKVPPQILTEGGNKFMRITGSAGDKQSVPSTYPNRNRSHMEMTNRPADMPLISNTTQRQTYSVKMRYNDNNGDSGVNIELFQAAPGGETSGYGTHNGNGPVIIIWRYGGRVKFGANYANETKRDTVDLGAIPVGTWHTYTVKVVWSHNPSQGRIDFYLDGQLKKTITGRDVCLGPDSNRIPSMKLELYGDYAVGSIDVDNVKAVSSDPLPPPSVAINTPANVRIVN